MRKDGSSLLRNKRVQEVLSLCQQRNAVTLTEQHGADLLDVRVV